MTLVLLVGTAIALLSIAELEVGTAGARTSSSIATVRSYYAALAGCMVSGDLGSIKEVVDPTLLETLEA
jgi:hypothetical protein